MRNKKPEIKDAFDFINKDMDSEDAPVKYTAYSFTLDAEECHQFMIDRLCEALAYGLLQLDNYRSGLALTNPEE